MRMQYAVCSGINMGMVEMWWSWSTAKSAIDIDSRQVGGKKSAIEIDSSIWREEIGNRQ
jgi:hypothetical protein